MKEEPIIYDRLSCDNCSDKSSLDGSVQKSVSFQ
ncbi:MAG: hypothetical protein ACJAUY_002083 [Cognaticolwellia sp.]|jgi:hypothetical protein